MFLIYYPPGKSVVDGESIDNRDYSRTISESIHESIADGTFDETIVTMMSVCNEDRQLLWDIKQLTLTDDESLRSMTSDELMDASERIKIILCERQAEKVTV